MEEFEFVKLANPKLFHSNEKIVFSILDVYKIKLDLDGLKCGLKSVYVADLKSKR